MKLNIGGITEAGMSKMNKTGNWSYYIPVLNKDGCNGCGLCEKFCPESCIDIVDNLRVVNDYFCKGCGICAAECPVNAVTLKQKSGVV